MADLNRVFLVGRLTHDAELKYTTSNRAVCEFSIAINTPKKEGGQWKDEAMFINRISFWGERAEAVAEYLLKGKLVFVEGKLRMDEWEQDGQKRRMLKVVAFNVQILSSPRTDSTGGALSDKPFKKPDEKLPDDDLPF